MIFGIQGVADAQGAVGLEQGAFHLVIDRFVNDQAAGSGAALSGGTHRSEYHRRHRQLQVGVFGEDNRVIAAQFQDVASHPLGDHFGHMATRPGRAGKGDQVHPGVLHHRLPNGGGIPDQQRKDAFGNIVFLQHIADDMLAGDRGQRHLVGGLPDVHIAAHRGDHRIPGPYRHREIEGGNHAHDAQRMILVVHPVAGPL